DGEELVWDRAFGRLRNTVVLPAGWRLTALSSPGVIQTLPDGRLSVYVVNPRNDDGRGYLRARRRGLRRVRPSGTDGTDSADGIEGIVCQSHQSHQSHQSPSALFVTVFRRKRPQKIVFDSTLSICYSPPLVK